MNADNDMNAIPKSSKVTRLRFSARDETTGRESSRKWSNTMDTTESEEVTESNSCSLRIEKKYIKS